MSNIYNIGTANDPILAGLQNPMQAAINDYDLQLAQIEATRQKLMQSRPQQAQVNQSRSPIWDEIEREMSAMSNRELKIVGENADFTESNNAIEAVFNREYLKIMRPLVEGTPDGREALEKHLGIVRKLKRTAGEEASKNLDLFNEYTEKYSKMTYAEFLEMKKGGKKK